MLHPSYTDLMKVVNRDVADGEEPVISSRYSIVLATAKRARQIIAREAGHEGPVTRKPLSQAVRELSEGRLRILAEEPDPEEEQ